jgi:hypothetical protein
VAPEDIKIEEEESENIAKSWKIAESILRRIFY